MWIFRNDAMLSIVEDWDNPDFLLVRARKDGDIQRVFPSAVTHTKLGSDYGYRAWIPRDEVATAMFNSIMDIDYHNFKDSINKSDRDRKDAYMKVWTAMYNYQDKVNPMLNVWKYEQYDEVDGTGMYLDYGYRDTEYYDQIFNKGEYHGPKVSVDDTES